MEDLSFGATSTLDPYYARENEIVYSVGKIVGHTGSMIAGAAGAVVAGGAAFITSPTGFGVIVCGSAAAVSAGVAVSAAKNLAQFAKSTRSSSSKEGMDLVKLTNSQLKELGLNAHEIKNNYVGGKISRYDLYGDKDTGRIYIFQKGGKGQGIATNNFYK